MGKEQISVRLDPDAMNRVRDLADEENRPISNLIECFVLKGLEEYGEPEDE